MNQWCRNYQNKPTLHGPFKMMSRHRSLFSTLTLVLSCRDTECNSAHRVMCEKLRSVCVKWATDVIRMEGGSLIKMSAPPSYFPREVIKCWVSAWGWLGPVFMLCHDHKAAYEACAETVRIKGVSTCRFKFLSQSKRRLHANKSFAM